MKKIISILICTLIVVSAVVAEKRFVMLDKVVAVVGNSSINYSDVKQLAKQLVEQRRAQGYTSDRNPQDEALENLLLQKLLYNQALIDSVEINQSDVVSRVEQQVQSMVDEAGSITALEKRSHMAIYHIRDLMRRQFEEQAYAQSMQQSVISKSKVVPGEVERFYAKLDKDSTNSTGDDANGHQVKTGIEQQVVCRLHDGIEHICQSHHRSHITEQCNDDNKARNAGGNSIP